MSMSMFQLVEKLDKKCTTRKKTKTMKHDVKFNTEFYDVIQDTYYGRRSRDNTGLTSQATASCDACGTNPSCLVVKTPEKV